MQLTLRDASDEMVGDGYLGGLSTFRAMLGKKQSRTPTDKESRAATSHHHRLSSADAIVLF